MLGDAAVVEVAGTTVTLACSLPTYYPETEISWFQDSTTILPGQTSYSAGTLTSMQKYGIRIIIPFRNENLKLGL